MGLGFDEPLYVGTIAFRDTVRVAFNEKVRLSAGKRNRIEGLKSGARPLAMPLLLKLFGPIREQSADLDEHMVAAKAKSRRGHGHS